MAENFLESELLSDRGVDSLQLRVDEQRLVDFQNSLKGPESRGMNKFIERLNALMALNKNAELLRQKQTTASIPDAPQVGGVSVAVETRDPELIAHNEQIQKLHQAVQEFNASRSAFLNSFIARYISPEPGKIEPRAGTRVERRPGPDYFAQMLAKPPEPMTPEEAANARYLAFLETPDAKKFDAMSDDEIRAILMGFRTQGLGKAVTQYEGMPDREIVKRMMFAMKTGSIRGQFDAILRTLAQHLTKS